METHSDMLPMIRQAFAHHRMRKGPGLSWRFARPGAGSIYSFRVTWTPGAVTVTGDIDAATYQVWPSFGTLWGAIELVHQAGFDYLTGKSRARKEFDQDATVRHILRCADDQMRHGDFSIWEKIVGEWGWRDLDRRYRNGAVQMVAAAEMRKACDLTAERVYNLFGDSELPVYSYGPSTRWQYEAVKLWAAEMLRREPAWHRLWRRWQKARERLRSDLRSGLLWRPEIHRPASGGSFNSCEPWVRHRWESGGESWRSVSRFRVFGIDMSRFGLWVYQGSAWPIRDPQDEARFVRAGA